MVINLTAVKELPAVIIFLQQNPVPYAIQPYILCRFSQRRKVGFQDRFYLSAQSQL